MTTKSTMIEQFGGGEEGADKYKDFMRKIASKGGKNSPAPNIEARRKGGRNSVKARRKLNKS